MCVVDFYPVILKNIPTEKLLLGLLENWEKTANSQGIKNVLEYLEVVLGIANQGSHMS